MNKTKSKITVFYGDEEFLIGEQIELVRAKVPDPILNLEIFNGGSLSPEKLQFYIQNQPMLGGEKTIIIEDFKAAAETQDQYVAILNKLPDNTRVFISARSLDKRTKLFRLFDQNGEIIEFNSFAPWEEEEKTAAWIENRFKKYDRSVSRGTACLMYAISGANLRSLDQEINKLITYAGDKREIEEKDVLAAASSCGLDVFALMDALRQKNAAQALAIFNDLLKNKQEIFQLLGLMAKQYRLMLQISIFPFQKRDPYAMARELGESAFFIRKCAAETNNFGNNELKLNLEKILKASMEIKSGKIPQIAMELLLSDLCGAKHGH